MIYCYLTYLVNHIDPLPSAAWVSDFDISSKRLNAIQGSI